QMAGKHQTVRSDAARRSFIAQIRLSVLIVLKQPYNTAFHRFEKPHPDIEYGRRNLPLIVEAAENKALWRQPDIRPRRHMLGNGALTVLDPIAIGKLNDAFRIVGLLIKWKNDCVGNNVVDELRPSRARKSVIIDLNGCRSVSQDTGARTVRMAIKVDRN